jgi:hypothetical protein
VYRVQYFCPRQAPFWQDLTTGLIFKTPQTFPDLTSAQMVCNSLVWQYHSARVLDPSGRVVYQV